jgi:DNA-binding NarL/FixJ family response regulator
MNNRNCGVVDTGLTENMGVEASFMRILIADDHEMMRRVTMRILQSRRDIECIEARNGNEAIQKAIELKPDLIVLDISMPAVGGFNAAREIKQYLPDVPILFFSIYDDGEYLDTAKSIGQGVVFKDQAGTTLLKAVDALLQKRTFFPSSGSPSE